MCSVPQTRLRSRVPCRAPTVRLGAHPAVAAPAAASKDLRAVRRALWATASTLAGSPGRVLRRGRQQVRAAVQPPARLRVPADATLTVQRGAAPTPAALRRLSPGAKLRCSPC